jgi:hypothetical protein
MPLRLVSRLPHLGQRTRRFFHAQPFYPVVYWIATAKAVPDLGFRASNGPTQLDAVSFRLFLQVHELGRIPLPR